MTAAPVRQRRRVRVAPGFRALAAVALVSLGCTMSCASSPSGDRLEQAYQRRWLVAVTSHKEDVESCQLVGSLSISSLPCTNFLHDVYMAGTECACFWTVYRGGDTLLVKKWSAGDVYVCRAPLLPSEELAATK
jgi:hypothetical protein